MTATDGTGSPSAGREFVQALERGFAVIKAFSGATRPLSMAEVAERTGLARAVARRYLLTLGELHCVQQHEGRFMLTPRVLDLGFAYLSTMSVASLAQPAMEEVAKQLGESCSLSVLDGREIVYIARVPAKRIMSINLVVGSRLPAHATSMGKVLLAYLPPSEVDAFFAGPPLPAFTSRTICHESALRKALAKVRENGWALSEGEVEVGIRSVAAPLWDHRGRVSAAINVSAHTSRISKADFVGHHLPVLLAAAARISKSLSGRML
jgi:IclR family pca regulon transcriptional regulator